LQSARLVAAVAGSLSHSTRHEQSNHYLASSRRHCGCFALGCCGRCLCSCAPACQSATATALPVSGLWKRADDIFNSSLWDGEDSLGRWTGGTSEVGTCKSCGVHCEHLSVWDNDTKQRRYESRVLTDEQWQRETGPTMKRQRAAAEWPFNGGQSHVAE